MARWQLIEDELLREKYQQTCVKRIWRLLPRRTMDAIHKRASRLKLTRARRGMSTIRTSQSSPTL